MLAISSRRQDRIEEDRVEEEHDRIDWLSATPFLLVHAAPLAIVFTGFTLDDVFLAIGLYLGRMFFITAGYHRYFSHRSFRLGRVAQCVMAIGGVTAAQKGPLWWASHHRRHHRGSDTKSDVHSPNDGLWWSHIGWILSNRYKRVDWVVVKDLSSYPELLLIDRYQAVGPWVMALVCLAVAGWGGVVAFCVSTVCLWHATFAVNSLAHRFGRRRYETRDNSRNCALLALLTLGEGWHNNHHYFPPSARQGHRWWELDPTWYALRALAAVGLVHKLRTLPARAAQVRKS